jgi:hypothetical protein
MSVTVKLLGVSRQLGSTWARREAYQVDFAALRLTAVAIAVHTISAALRGTVADCDVNLRRSWADDHVFDGYLCATDLPGEKVFEVEDVEGRARRLLRRPWKGDRVDARAFPVRDEQDIPGSGGKAGDRPDVRRGRVLGGTQTAGNGDE